MVYVRLSKVKRKGRLITRATLRVRPTVQGAAIVLDNRTGRILAMAGGFSYRLSQINRTTQTERQPGSSFKPFSYLATLNRGLQPNTLVRDQPITFAPIDRATHTRRRDYWTPRNYDHSASGVITLRRALERSKNLATAQLLDGVIDHDPVQSLGRVCELAIEAAIYKECVAYYPFVLGAQPLRLIDLAAFYAAIANEGLRPAPFAIEQVERNGKVVFQRKPESKALAGGDRVAFVQLRSILQGVLARGTARTIARHAPYVGGKTGTTDGANDAWFVGFSNDVTIGVWVGYDNAKGKRRTLGRGQTGGKVALPIFASIIDSVWRSYAKKTPIAPPSPEAKRKLIALPINLRSGDRIDHRSRGAFTEYFRLDPTGRLAETQYSVVPEAEFASHYYRDPRTGQLYRYPNGYGSGYGYPYDSRWYAQPRQYRRYYRQQNPLGGLFGGVERRLFQPRHHDYGRRDYYRPRRGDPQFPFARRWW